MPSRNVLKIDIPSAYYHVYARGNNRMLIYQDKEDYTVFLNLFKRYLSKQPVANPYGEEYPHLYGKLELLTYCLMSNHFHLLLYQEQEGTMTQLMRGIMTTYSRYFNKKYNRSGPLFETRYKAALITNDVYLQHISRYIHLNPKQWQTYPYSSLHFYLDKQKADWVKPKRILDLFDSKAEYSAFIADYEDHKKALKDIKHELANDKSPYLL